MVLFNQIIQKKKKKKTFKTEGKQYDASFEVCKYQRHSLKSNFHLLLENSKIVTELDRFAS